ncbi:alkaline phosphatase family protein [Legionella dresdenensis]|uniref:Alkaline phosphatase family protein n=1 Tax=Legionella dresdenensis TaxID=450200 RepID=A0ABV8CE71_9GAMM
MKKPLSLIMMLASSALIAEPAQPKLIVQIVVDQLRGDLIHQYQDQFGSEGFNYLLAHSLDFHNAHHPHANTVTCVGHSTIATGSYPALHGIVSNSWIDRQSGKEVYCVDDDAVKILPTVRTKVAPPGSSPRNLVASTFSDEIILSQKGRAFGVSLKDRSAITLAGHAGKAFWFDKVNGGFITSDYYYTKYPQWVQDWNAHYDAVNETWTLSKPANQYRFAHEPIFHHTYSEFGVSFPHHTGNPERPLYYKLLSMTPNADELTADFAMDLLKSEKLGQTPGKTDYLAISFSAVDAIGHQFGPNSLESEDNLLRLDKTMAKVLKQLDQQVGLKNTLIVLTADHGVTDTPDYLAKNHITQIPAIKTSDLREKITALLADKFNLPAESLQGISPPYVYLDHTIISKQHLSLAAVTRYLAEQLRQYPGIFQAYPLPLASTEKDWLTEKVDRMGFPNRTGDLYLVPPAYQDLAEKALRVSHGTPWQYDSYVPLLFVNPLFKAQHISRPVRTTDIAATLSAILMIKAPSASVGQPLTEVMAFYEGKA